MGDHGGLLPNGLLPSAAAGFVARVLDPERWGKAEERTAELVARIQPTWAAEERRSAVAGYVQRLIMKCFPCKVVTFGSVPLKTYLPDGDIDLTAFSENENMNLKDTWAVEVRNVLESEEKNENAEFRVKEVQYIQAEVKIIKCLVEDIVVDISFDQVGGLCTLCFLNEIDALINQNHLFKRSIILIKAWCYYESRILGAHHGLISTYALETLVLYIFNVYNNSFAGPLEVLYRFLEFFSNFDWEKFCISLWGPIPISSLPDMTSEPPRKDGGELLLSKPFLDFYSTVFAVFPAGHDNQSQPFVSKHFNIIDPLRIRNNLGRSVSKGNFFRIRSAFAFGAKRLARLLECPEETVVAELNQFFTNTWERHGSGNRPDVPSPNLQYLRPIKAVLAKESDNARSASSLKKNSDNNVLSSRPKYDTNGGLVSHGATSEVLNIVDQNFQSVYRTVLPTAVYHAQNQEGYGSQVDSEVSDLAGRNNNAIAFAQAHITQNNFWPDHSMSGHAGLDRFQLARTHSSPELSDTSPEILAIGSRNKVQEAENNHIGLTRFEQVSRRKHMGNDGPSNSRQHLPHRILETVDSSNALNNFHDPGKELASVSETLEMHQEEQDLVNMMASLHNVNGQIQLPIHFPSHMPFQLSPSVLASFAYNQRSLTGTVPPDIPMIDPSWVSNIQYPQGLVSPHISQYQAAAGPSFNSEDVTGSVNGNSGMIGVNSESGDQVLWHGDDGGSNRSDSDNGGQILNVDDKKQLRGSPTVVSSSRASNSGASSVREHHKVARESKRLVSEDDTGAIRYQTNKYNDSHSTTGTRSLGSFPISSDSSSRRKSASESSSDGSDKPPKSAKDKRGRRLAATAILTALYGNSRNGRQLDNSSDRNSARADDEVSSHAKNNQLPAAEPAELRASDSVVPIAPMLVNTPQQRVGENSGVFPIAFYPTGPPVPFLTMLPVYNFPSDTSGTDGSTTQYDSDERLHPGAASRDGHNFDSVESLSEVNMSSSSLGNSNSEPPEEHKFDILNSDSASHWHNLQYGRSCQNRHHGPVMHPSPMLMPPVYLQGHFPWDGPGRPSPNMNLFTQFMGYGPRRVPVAPLQPGPLRTPVFQHYGEEVPRYRGGTGTYLPNPKFPVRDRSSSNVRNHRGNYNQDRNDPDREASWNNTKSRTAGMVHGRSQIDRASSRPDRSSSNDSRPDRQWNGHNKHDPLDSYQAPSATFCSRKSSQGSANTAYGVYSMPPGNLNGIGPPRPAVPSSVKLYHYDQGVMYGSRAEPLKFGSLGLVHLPGGSEATEPGDENPARDGYQQRQGTYRGSSRSSPG